EPESGERAIAFPVDLLEIGVEVLRGHAGPSVGGGPGIVLAQHVVGDAEDVEPGASVEIHELGKRQFAVAPRRVSVELAQESRRPGSHLAVSVPAASGCRRYRTVKIGL